MKHVARPAKRALVIGVNGQDGSYLAQHLIDAHWEVHGLGRQEHSRWVKPKLGLHYHSINLSDADALWKLLKTLQPDAVFHFAAVHGAAGFSYESKWREVHAVNVVTVHAVLEYQRCIKPSATLIYASSSKVFGKKLFARISEHSPRYSTCIYTTTKNAATDLISFYRKQHQLKCSIIWTFNHESPRRGSSYFLPKIVDTLAKAIIEPKYTAEIDSLGFWGDWGDANEFMQLIANLPSSAAESDIIFATGRTIWAEDFVAALFGKFGLDWRAHLLERFPLIGNRPDRWYVDTTELQRHCGGVPARTMLEIATDMLQLCHPAAWRQAALRDRN
jgi:GDPmannose 4,6-dehydratase